MKRTARIVTWSPDNGFLCVTPHESTKYAFATEVKFSEHGFVLVHTNHEAEFRALSIDAKTRRAALQAKYIALS